MMPNEIAFEKLSKAGFRCGMSLRGSCVINATNRLACNDLVHRFTSDLVDQLLQTKIEEDIAFIANVFNDKGGVRVTDWRADVSEGKYDLLIVVSEQIKKVFDKNPTEKMKHTIHKQPLVFYGDLCTLTLPVGAEIVKLAYQNDILTMWYGRKVDEQQMERRTFRIVGTGHEIEESDNDVNYIDTVFQDSFVWHILEIDVTT